MICQKILEGKIAKTGDEKKKKKFEMLYDQINNQIYKTSIEENILKRMKLDDQIQSIFSTSIVR